ncbi:MAG TPA: rod shape-determining protein MreD [Gemmatimonadota bacterium]|nr:rod shape-determining protein MreD [Gemmatimonadota bacterium]
MSLVSRGTPWVARMSRGRFAFFAAVCVVGALFLEPPLEIAGATPDFVLILAVYGAIRAGAMGGAALGFVTGLFRDTLLLMHFGLYALGLTVIGYAVGKMRESLYLDAPAADLLLLAGGKLLLDVLVLGVAAGGAWKAFELRFFWESPGSIVYTTAMGAVLSRLIGGR